MANISPEVIKLAQDTEAKYGVPASVTIAQYGLESGWGGSNLAKNANNYFGISGKNVNTGKFVMSNGRTWAAYNSMQESFYDHGRLLSTPLYANAHHNTKNAYQYIDAIAEIYAPSSDGNNNYAATLKSIISQNNLTQYDKSGGTYTPGTTSGGSGFYVPGSGNSGSISGGGFGGSTVKTENVKFLGIDWSTILGKIVKFIALVIVGVMGAVFFFSAFNIENPIKGVAKSVKKAVQTDGG